MQKITNQAVIGPILHKSFMHSLLDDVVWAWWMGPAGAGCCADNLFVSKYDYSARKKRRHLNPVWYSYSSDSSADVWEQGHTHSQTQRSRPPSALYLDWSTASQRSLGQWWRKKTKKTTTKNKKNITTDVEKWHSEKKYNEKSSALASKQDKWTKTADFHKCTFSYYIKNISNHASHKMDFFFLLLATYSSTQGHTM